jgi:hypothetical protein
LNAVEIEMHQGGKASTQQGFGDSRRPFKQNVARNEVGRKKLPNDSVLAQNMFFK